jgi:hypothetical protein
MNKQYKNENPLGREGFNKLWYTKLMICSHCKFKKKTLTRIGKYLWCYKTKWRPAFFFSSLVLGTQDLLHTREALYHLSHTPCPFVCIFWDSLFELVILWVAGIISMRPPFFAWLKFVIVYKCDQMIKGNLPHH